MSTHYSTDQAQHVYLGVNLAELPVVDPSAVYIHSPRTYRMSSFRNSKPQQ